MNVLGTLFVIALIALLSWGFMYIIGNLIVGGGASPFFQDRRIYRQQKRVITKTYPRIVGYDGVWFQAYCDKNGLWVEPGFEFAIVEIGPRTFTLMDTIEARRQGIPEREVLQ